MLLISLDLNCFSSPLAEITLLFLEPVGLNGALSGISQGTGGRKNEANVNGWVDNPTTIDLKIQSTGPWSGLANLLSMHIPSSP